MQKNKFLASVIDFNPYISTSI